MPRRLTVAQRSALAAMAQAPLVRTVAGWCHDGNGGLDAFSSNTIEAISRHDFCRVSGPGRRLKATITTAGRNALQVPTLVTEGRG